MNMYRHHILELYKEPNNKGKLHKESTAWEEHNITCGDKIRIGLLIEKEKVKDVRFSGDGCAISIASASLITDYIKGKSLQEIKKITHKKIVELLGIEVAPARIKCADLALNTTIRAIEVYNARN